MISIPLFSKAKLLQTEIDTREAMRLDRCFRVLNDSDNIDFEWATVSEGNVESDVGEWQDVLINNAAFGKIKFSIKKDQGKVAVSDEAKKRGKTNGFDFMEIQRSQLGPAFAKSAEAKQIGAIKKNPQTFSAAKNWALETTNPVKDLLQASLKLKVGNRREKYLILNPQDAADLLANDFILKYITAGRFSADLSKISEFNLIQDENDIVSRGTAYLTAGAGVGYWVNGEVAQEPTRVTGQGDVLLMTNWNGVSGPLDTVKVSGNVKNAGAVEMTLINTA